MRKPRLASFSVMMEARKVQKVGYSTLIVSLPKDWVEEVSLKQGDIVSFRRESDGGITVYPGLTRERENHRYIIDADLCDGPNLLTRIITANYLTGHDTIQITSKKELSSRHLEEVRAVSRRLTGLGIVEQTLKSVTLPSGTLSPQASTVRVAPKSSGAMEYYSLSEELLSRV